MEGRGQERTCYFISWVVVPWFNFGLVRGKIGSKGKERGIFDIVEMKVLVFAC
jgi:hypothetical protein